MSPNNHLSFSKSYMLSVHEAIKISYSYHLPCQGSRNCQKSDVSNHSIVCWHGSVAFPILPIHIANLSRLSKCTLPIISIPNPLKLSNSQISYHRQNKPSAQLPQPTRSQTGKWEEFWDWTPISPGELIRQSPCCPGQGHSQQEVLSAHCSR